MNIGSHSGLKPQNKRVEQEIIKTYIFAPFRIRLLNLDKEYGYEKEINRLYKLIEQVEKLLTEYEINSIDTLFREPTKTSSRLLGISVNNVMKYKKNIREKLLPLLD